MQNSNNIDPDTMAAAAVSVHQTTKDISTSIRNLKKKNNNNNNNDINIDENNEQNEQNEESVLDPELNHQSIHKDDNKYTSINENKLNNVDSDNDNEIDDEIDQINRIDDDDNDDNDNDQITNVDNENEKTNNNNNNNTSNNNGIANTENNNPMIGNDNNNDGETNFMNFGENNNKSKNENYIANMSAIVNASQMQTQLQSSNSRKTFPNSLNNENSIDLISNDNKIRKSKSPNSTTSAITTTAAAAAALLKDNSFPELSQIQKRAQQNRAAQRSFRQRRKEKITKLEDKAAKYEEALKTIEALQEENAELKRQLLSRTG
jgi:hypothetical protein